MELDLNLKYKTIKLLNDNIEENLNDLGYGDDFLDMTQGHDLQFCSLIVVFFHLCL